MFLGIDLVLIVLILLLLLIFVVFSWLAIRLKNVIAWLFNKVFPSSGALHKNKQTVFNELPISESKKIDPYNGNIPNVPGYYPGIMGDIP